MDIEFNCSKCGQHIVIDEEGAGMTVQCPKCQAELVVPQAQPTPSKSTAPSKTASIISKLNDLTSLPPTLPSTANAGALHSAVLNGDQSAVEQLVANGVSVNAKDDRGATPLHYARITAMAEWLLANGAEVNAKDSKGRTPLFNALDKGVDKHVVELLLAKGADVNVRSNSRLTPFHRAAFCDHSDLEKVELLLAKGADVNAKDDRGATPLHCVRIPAMAEWLLANGADVNFTDSKGRTPLFNALDKGVDKHVVKVLLAKGADVNVRSISRMTPLHRAASCDQSELEKVELLLAKGADVNAKNDKGRTPLDLAVAQGRHDVVKLLRNYQGIDAILAQANTLTLHEAVKQDDKVMVTLLITKGADVNAKDDKGMTPLDLALAHHKRELAEILTAKGALTTTANDRLNDRFIMAMLSGNKAAVQKLIAEGPDLGKALMCAIRLHVFDPAFEASGEMIKLLLARGAVPVEGIEPLHDAVATGNKAAVEKLIAEGADVNKNNVYGMTPLDWAQFLGKEELGKLLIEKGAAKAEWLTAQEAGSDGADKQSESENRTDRYIATEVRLAVWRRDEGKCVVCRSNEKLEYDHIIPVSKGGSNTARNVQLLCEKCNREKAGKIA